MEPKEKPLLIFKKRICLAESEAKMVSGSAQAAPSPLRLVEEGTVSLWVHSTQVELQAM